MDIVSRSRSDSRGNGSSCLEEAPFKMNRLVKKYVEPPLHFYRFNVSARPIRYKNLRIQAQPFHPFPQSTFSDTISSSQQPTVNGSCPWFAARSAGSSAMQKVQTNTRVDWHFSNSSAGAPHKPTTSHKTKEEFVQILLANCKELLTKHERVLEPLALEEEDLNIEDLKGAPPQELLRLAMNSQVGARKVHMLIESASEELVEMLVQQFEASTVRLVTNEFAYMLPRALCTRSQAFGVFFESYCLQHFVELSHDKFGLRALKGLAVSPTFCRAALAQFEKNYDKLIQDMQAIIFLATLITLAPEEESLRFVINDFKHRMKGIGNGHALRVLSSVAERISGPLLDQLANTLEPHVPWLIDDRLGNFGTQTLLKKGCVGPMRAFQKKSLEEPIHLFVKKYRKYVYLEVLKMEGMVPFIRQVVSAVTTNKAYLRQIFKREESTKILLVTLIEATLSLNALHMIMMDMLDSAFKDKQIFRAQYFWPFIDMMRLYLVGNYDRLVHLIQKPPVMSRLAQAPT
jgi:hypothetical protein